MSFLNKFRLTSWVIKAFLNKHGRLIIASFIIGIIGFFLIYKTFPYIPRPKKHLRLGRIGKYSYENIPEEILSQLSLGLTGIKPDGSAGPSLAKSWEISDDGLVYIFFLQDNLFWLDKTPVTAYEIKYNFSDVEQTVIDERTIKFQLKEPFSPFLTILSKPVFKKEYLGVGPYNIRKIKKSGNNIEKITLTSKENDLTYCFYPTFEAIITAYKLGEIDEFETMSLDLIGKDWLKNAELKEEISVDHYLGIFFNAEIPLLSEKSIRQAFAYAIKEKPEGDSRATGPISPTSWAYNEEVKLYPFDEEKAKELFKSAGEEKHKLKILTNASFLSLAEQIKSSWKEVLGLEVEIELVNTLTEEYEVFIGVFQVPADPDQYVVWHSTRQENITNFKSPKIDKLLEDGRKIVDQDLRQEKYFDFQKFLAEECPVVFLSHPVLYTIRRKIIF